MGSGQVTPTRRSCRQGVWTLILFAASAGFAQGLRLVNEDQFSGAALREELIDEDPEDSPKDDSPEAGGEEEEAAPGREGNDTRSDSGKEEDKDEDEKEDDSKDDSKDGKGGKAGKNSQVLGESHLIEKKPQMDPFKYQHATFQNGLRVLNIQDPKAETIGLAVGITAGSFLDPEDALGVAHFCEHMLFLGSKQFPEPTGFKTFIAAKSGSSNANTAGDRTVFYMMTARSGWKQGLQRYADFFRAPLFTEKFVSKEVEAIVSEQQRNIKNTKRRIRFLMLAMASPTSPLSRFHTGDKQTLVEEPKEKGIDMVERLKEFYEQYYCPGRMRLVTYGKFSLSKQLKDALANFGDIPAGNCSTVESVALLSNGMRIDPGEKVSEIGQESSDAEARPKDEAAEGEEPKADKDSEEPNGDESQESETSEEHQEAQESNKVDVANNVHIAEENSQETVAEVARSAPNPWKGDDGASLLGKWLHAMGESASQLWIMWALPSLRPYYRERPEAYLRYALMYKGTGSLMYLLRQHARLIVAGEMEMSSYPGSSQLWLTLSLTAEGAYHVGRVMDIVYAYLALLHSNGVSTQMLKSVAKAENMKWNYRERASLKKTLPNLAASMTWLPPDDILSGGAKLDKPNKKLTNVVLKGLKPSNMNIAFVDPRKKAKETEVEKLAHFGVQYTKKDIPKDEMTRWTRWLSEKPETVRKELNELMVSSNFKALPDMEHPPVIEDIPDNISLAYASAEVGNDTESKTFGVEPKNLKSNGPDALWYRQGSTSSSPKAHVLFIIRKENSEVTREDVLHMNLYTQLRQWILEPKVAAQRAAGLDFKFSFKPETASFGFWGIAENLPKLVSKVLKELHSEIKMSNETELLQFEQVKSMLRRSLFGHSKTPVPYAMQDRDTMLIGGRYSKRELFMALDDVQPEDTASAMRRLLLNKKLQYTTMVFGNLQQKDAEYLHDECRKIMGGNLTLSLDKVPLVDKVVRLPKPVEVRKVNPKKGDPNQVIVVTILQDVPVIADRVYFGILGKLFKHTAFAELRTQRQFGYEVRATSAMISNIWALTVVVQGKKSPDEVEPVIEWLMSDKMPAIIENLTDADVKSHTESFSEQLQKPPKSFLTEKHHYSKAVIRGGKSHFFDLRNRMLEFASTNVTKDALLEAWKKATAPRDESGTRRKITIKYFASAENKESDSKEAGKGSKEETESGGEGGESGGGGEEGGGGGGESSLLWEGEEDEEEEEGAPPEVDDDGVAKVLEAKIAAAKQADTKKGDSKHGEAKIPEQDAPPDAKITAPEPKSKNGKSKNGKNGKSEKKKVTWVLKSAPQRPAPEDFQAALEKAEVHEEALKVALKEYEETIVFDDASSDHREKLLQRSAEGKDSKDAKGKWNSGKSGGKADESEGYFKDVFGADGDEDDDYEVKEEEDADADGDTEEEGFEEVFDSLGASEAQETLDENVGFDRSEEEEDGIQEP
eukprot:TRINITY_DN25656_c0_g1_i1.p1 TRINITY_DN25656_c0_g1~~TRINITY_DN25656_c0_g1_i1.p1  ORF type:complete len:1461 (-),score=472.19 TRINITY_DN25656_c0_g1_i1:324-4706(-)